MDVIPPLPVVDPLTSRFWEGCQRHQLLIQRCQDCGYLRHPPGPVCLNCRSSRSEWIPSAGRGQVYSWIVVRHPIPASVYADKVPYIVALIDLDEGVRVVSNIVDCSPEDVRAEMPVELFFRQVNESVTLPQFRRISRSS
jgi:uncharacterized OB-fold protein